MGDLAADTVIERTGDSTFRCELSSDWEIWGPNGGYLAAVALRAAGIASGRARPAALNGHFVGNARTATVDIDVEVNRHTKVASSITARLSQEGRLALTATVWGVDDDLDGLEHHTTVIPDVADPEDLQSLDDLAKGQQRHPFWDNIEQRPTSWIEEWENRPAAEPATQAWVRFRPTATFDDPWLDACRSLILIDLDSWPATVRAHVGELEHYAPTIELAARFAGSTASDPWLLSEAHAPVATGGLVLATGRIWTRDRRLVAMGGSTLLSRPAARRPDR